MRTKVILTTIILSALFLVLYWWIRSLPSSVTMDHLSMPVTVESGEEIFWGRGRCHVCHRVGERGYALRGPNLGASNEGPPIGQKAKDRAEELGLRNSTEYLVQSIVEPGAFVVPNYKDEMPKVYQAPIVLSAEEIKAVLLYLQSQGGEPDLAGLTLPSVLESGRAKSNRRLAIQGNVENGRRLFFDLQGPAACASCHVGIDENGATRGSATGPDLTALASFRTPEHIRQKIIKADSNLVSGYDQVMITTNDGRLYAGRIEEETDERLVLQLPDMEVLVISKAEIAGRAVSAVSSMPGNYAELLSQQQLDDLLAYLLTLEGR